MGGSEVTQELPRPKLADAVMNSQIGGTHYGTGNAMQPWHVWEAFDLDPWEANAVKYLLRWRKKGGVEDLKKARHYIDYLIAKEEK